MIGIQIAKQRFSLYNLDEGEMFIKDFVAKIKYFEPTKKRIESLQGMLYLGSRSLIFEPDDVSFSLVKFKFKEMASLPFIIPSSNSEKPSTLNFELKRIIEIPGNFTEAYKIHQLSKENNNNEVEISFIFEKINVVSKIISELIDKYNSKESFFEFDSVEYLGSIYSFKFDLTVIKSANELFQFDRELYIKQLLPLIEVPGLMRITDQRLYFQPLFKLNSKRSISVKHKTITQLYKRKVHLKHVGIEIITPKKSLFFEFENETYRNTIFDIISKYTNEQCETNISIDKYTKLWIDGGMSNYDYLLKLNSAANRTRNDLAQYPVFPWTIINFSSDTLDLNDPSNYRDLTKPIGAINPKRLDDFINRFNDMPEPKFIYGTHYSNPAYVIGYLARMYPEYMLKLHGGRFDNPDRLFASVETDWNICYSNPGSLKELIPEFFEKNIEFLLNNKKIDLGISAKGEKIDNVILPLWAESPANFLEVMRDSLESKYVNENIHHWIDLIFGYKQRGEEAIKANNLFHPVSYEDGRDFAGKDEMEIRMIQIQATEFGQCPNQLFSRPHPKKFSKGINEIFMNFDEKDLKLASFNGINVQNQSHTEDNTNHIDNSNKISVQYNFDKINFIPLLKHHKQKVTSSSYLSETKLLATGAEDGFLKIYDIKTSGVKRMIQISNLALTSIAEMNESNLLIIGSANNKVYLLNTTLGKATSSFEAHEDSVVALFYSQSRGVLITNSADSTYKTWNLQNSTKLPLHIYYDTENSIVSADYREEDNAHICVDQDGNFVYRILDKSNECTKLLLDVPSEETFVKFDSTNRNQYYIGNEEKCDLYDGRMNKVISSFAWENVKGVINDTDKAIVMMKEKSLMLTALSNEKDIVKEWDEIASPTHLRMKAKEGNGVIIVGNENGDVYYSEL